METTILARFSPCPDEESLRAAIEAVCAKFAPLISLRIFPTRPDGEDGPVRCFCLLKLVDPDAQHTLSSELDGVTEYGDYLAFTVDLDGECVS
jgi:hypothetical protein